MAADRKQMFQKFTIFQLVPGFLVQSPTPYKSMI